jgi:CRP-like cAMP-binding protein
VSFVYGTDTVLYVAVSAHKLGTGPKGLGYLMAGLGVGGILIGFAIDRLAASRRLALVIVGGAVFYCLPTALLTMIHSPGLAVALQVVRGASTVIVDVLALTMLQRAVAPDIAGRVLGVFYAVILGATSLGSLITSPIVGALGLNAGLLIMAFAPAALAALGYPSLARLDRATAARVAELAPRVVVLERLGLFAGARQTALERLAAACTEVSFGAGEAIVREGDESDALYVLVDGEVEVTARGEGDSEPRRLRTMGPDSYFGEIGLLEGIPRTATVTALQPCRCYRLEGEDFLDVLTTTPPPTALLESASARLALTHPSRELSYAPAAAASGTA